MEDTHKFGDKKVAITAFIVGFILTQLLFHFVILK